MPDVLKNFFLSKPDVSSLVVLFSNQFLEPTHQAYLILYALSDKSSTLDTSIVELSYYISSFFLMLLFATFQSVLSLYYFRNISSTFPYFPYRFVYFFCIYIGNFFEGFKLISSKTLADSSIICGVVFI